MINRLGPRGRLTALGMVASILATLVCLPVAAVSASSAATSKAPSAPSLTRGQRLEIEEVLTDLAQDIVAKQDRMEGQGVIASPTVRFSDDGKSLIVELGKGYVPKINGIELEDHLRAIETPLTFHLEKIFPVYEVTFLFGGRDIFYYFPDDWRPSPPSRKAASGASHLEPLANSVLISAGHGLYFHRGYKDWRAARDPANGITEDFITPVMAADLATYLNDRSGVESVLVRSQSLATHNDSGQPWWRVSSRYHLKEMYPELASVWNSKGDQDYPLVEREEDIYSRPLFANYLGVDAILHVHTNAEANPSIRGARLYYQTGRQQDGELARSSLFYMAESVHSLPGYEAYPIAAEPHVGNHAENREARMISVIAEVGFHTNPEDSVAIQDPLFQKAMMRGFEKAYRLHRKGLPNQVFKVVSTPDVSMPPNGSTNVEASFSGYPRFPVKRVSEALECPAGLACTGSTRLLTETESPFVTEATCGGTPSGTIRWRATFTDADGLTSVSDFSMHCTQ